MNYYNEFDKYAAAWLRELIARGLIPAGDVDERSIVDVRGSDLAGYTQCHFFAGIGGWPYALALAGWPTTRPVWTGSCPCQPFSAAGKRRGTADERHLWPEFARLIGECRPPTVFGEQVASKAGREWLLGVFTDLEGMVYAGAGADLCAAGVGAPHIRQRLFWVANCEHDGSYRESGAAPGPYGDRADGRVSVGGGGAVGGLADRHDARRPPSRAGLHGERWEAVELAGCGAVGNCGAWVRVIHACECDEDGNCPVCGIDYGDCPCPGPTQEDEFEYRDGPDGLEARRILHAIGKGSQGHTGNGNRGREPGRLDTQPDGSITAPGFWSDFGILPFRDGKARRVERGTFPLVNGLHRGVVHGGDIGASYAQATAEARVMRIKGYGNAIVPQVATEFIASYMEATA